MDFETMLLAKPIHVTEGEKTALVRGVIALLRDDADVFSRKMVGAEMFHRSAADGQAFSEKFSKFSKKKFLRKIKKKISGPYFGAVWPDLWLLEGGISAFGSALLSALKMHQHFHVLSKVQGMGDSEIIELLEQCAIAKAGSAEAIFGF